MTRAVFDCMVFLQAAVRSTGPAGTCLRAARDGRLKLVISPEIIVEVRDVLTRPKTLKKFPALTVEAVEVFVRDVESQAVTLADVPYVSPSENPDTHKLRYSLIEPGASTTSGM